jgi:hypothetical protein
MITDLKISIYYLRKSLSKSKKYNQVGVIKIYIKEVYGYNKIGELKYPVSCKLL